MWIAPQVACQEPKAPSWTFLRAQWETLKTKGLPPLPLQQQQQRQGRGGGGGGGGGGREDEEGARLLWVISHAASRFPPKEAEALAGELLQV